MTSRMNPSHTLVIIALLAGLIFMWILVAALMETHQVISDQHDDINDLISLVERTLEVGEESIRFATEWKELCEDVRIP